MEFTQGVRFDALGLTEEVQRALKKKNIEESTPVQAGCIPPMREWKDVIAKAPTGTGKTFAFGIPIIEHIEPGSEETEAVILAPTRELAMQITAELRDLCVYLPGVRIVCLYGGAPIGKQIDALKKHPQIVVATPGRLSDHMKRRTVRSTGCRPLCSTRPTGCSTWASSTTCAASLAGCPPKSRPSSSPPPCPPRCRGW